MSDNSENKTNNDKEEQKKKNHRVLKLHHKEENRTVKRILDEDMDDIGSPEGANAYEGSYIEPEENEDLVERAKTKAKQTANEKKDKYALDELL